MPPRHTDTAAPSPEQITVSSRQVACDGGGIMGHPLVYMDMGEDDAVECHYCDRRFVLSKKSQPESNYLDPAARPCDAH